MPECRTSRVPRLDAVSTLRNTRSGAFQNHEVCLPSPVKWVLAPRMPRAFPACLKACVGTSSLQMGLLFCLWALTKVQCLFEHASGLGQQPVVSWPGAVHGDQPLNPGAQDGGFRVLSPTCGPVSHVVSKRHPEAGSSALTWVLRAGQRDTIHRAFSRASLASRGLHWEAEVDQVVS